MFSPYRLATRPPDGHQVSSHFPSSSAPRFLHCFWYLPYWATERKCCRICLATPAPMTPLQFTWWAIIGSDPARSEEHTSELQSRFDLVCRLLLEKKKIN